MKARGRWGVLALIAVTFTSAAAVAPSMLRRMSSFAVHRVEVRGTHLMPAYAALVQSGITRRSSVFDDFASWRARLLAHPMVLNAVIERRLPSTIRITITESAPVALARTPDLVPVDARGRALPIDPASADLDLPVLAMETHPNAGGRFADEATRSTVRVLAALEQSDARLFSWVSEAGALRDGGVRLALRSPAGAEVFVSSDPRALRLNELQVALADLAARGELSRLERIDARFHDQIVVALKNGN